MSTLCLVTLLLVSLVIRPFEVQAHPLSLRVYLRCLLLFQLGAYRLGPSFRNLQPFYPIHWCFHHHVMYMDEQLVRGLYTILGPPADEPVSSDLYPLSCSPTLTMEERTFSLRHSPSLAFSQSVSSVALNSFVTAMLTSDRLLHS
jgi:hypothetical protein